MGSNIFEERQAFNFYRSYYDTSLLLDKENRAEFLDSILHYQFTGEVILPNLPFALLAFNGQMHSLKKQVNGYTRGKETYPNGNPTKGGGKASDKGKCKEVQEKEEEKEKEENDTPPAASKPFTQFSKDDFHLEVKPFVAKYGKQTCRDFFNYWTEPNARGKMRFQLEKTWSVSNRLSTWKKNEGKFGNTEVPKQQTKVIHGPWNV